MTGGGPSTSAGGAAFDRVPASIAPLPEPPGLLWRQVCLLALLAGALAARFFWPGIAALVLLLLLDRRRDRTLTAVLLLALCFALGLAWSLWREPRPPTEPPWLRAYLAEQEQWRSGDAPRQRPLLLRARVESVSPLPQGRTRVILRDAVPVAGPRENNGNAAVAEALPYAGRIAWNSRSPLEAPLPGQEATALFRLARVRGLANPGAFETERYWHDQGIWLRAWTPGAVEETAFSGRATMAGALREEWRKRFVAALPTEGNDLSPGADILPALIFGDRSFLDREEADLVAKATLAHSLALSGLHLGYAAGLGHVLAWLLGRLFPSVLLRLPRPALSLLLALPLAGAYMWLGEAPVSLIRAALMLLFWTVLTCVPRPAVFLDGVLAALAVFLILEPAAIFDLRLQLSALCVTAIALSLPWIGSLTARLLPHGDNALHRLGRGILSLFLISLAVQVAVLPLAALAFGSVGLLFPLNMFWLPVLGMVVMPLAFAGLALSTLGLSGPAAWILMLAHLPCRWLLQGLAFLETHGLLWAPVIPRPSWPVMAGFWLLCVGLPMAALRRKTPARSKAWARLACGLGLSLFLFSLGKSLTHEILARDTVRLRLLDVGQGQAVALEWGGPWLGGRTLVDGGIASEFFDSGKSILIPVLTDGAPPWLDAAVSTHPDADHLGGLVSVLGSLRVGLFAHNGDPAAPELEDRLDVALARSRVPCAVWKSGDRIPLNADLTLEVLWPPPPSGGKGKRLAGNNASLVLRLIWRGKPLALLCGDAEPPSLRRLLAENPPPALQAPVLLLPHHGSAKSLVPELYQAVNPKIALASAAFGNQWGFPAKAVRQAMRERNILLFVTADQGQILLEWTSPDGPPVVGFGREEDAGRD